MPDPAQANYLAFRNRIDHDPVLLSLTNQAIHLASTSPPPTPIVREGGNIDFKQHPEIESALAALGDQYRNRLAQIAGEMGVELPEIPAK